MVKISNISIPKAQTLLLKMKIRIMSGQVVNLCLKKNSHGGESLFEKKKITKKTHMVVNLCLKRKTKTKNKNKNKKQKNSHGGESLFEKRLGRRPLDRELLPLLLTLLSGGDRQTKVSNLRPPKLVQQNISEYWKRLEQVVEYVGII